MESWYTSIDLHVETLLNVLSAGGSVPHWFNLLFDGRRKILEISVVEFLGISD